MLVFYDFLVVDRRVVVLKIGHLLGQIDESFNSNTHGKGSEFQWLHASQIVNRTHTESRIVDMANKKQDGVLYNPRVGEVDFEWQYTDRDSLNPSSFIKGLVR